MKDDEAPQTTPKILVIESLEDLHANGSGFHDMLRELAAGRFEVDPKTWTDGLMKTFPPDYRAVLMDCGRVRDYECDVVRKIRGELGVPILFHSTEDRTPVLEVLRTEGVTEIFRKPCGIGTLVERIVEHVTSVERGTPESEGEQSDPAP